MPLQLPLPMPLMLIEWIDSHSSAGGGWSQLDDLKTAAIPMYCRSVGWLVAKENSHIVLVPHLCGASEENPDHCGKGELTIPMRCITRMTMLTVPALADLPATPD
jgi:hypothetical protein